MKLNIRILYLYLFSFVGLIVTVIGGIRIIELGLKVYVFKGADRYEYARPYPVENEPKLSEEEKSVRVEEEKRIQEQETQRQRQREAAGAIAMMLVGFPLYKYHWNLIQKEHKN